MKPQTGRLRSSMMAMSSSGWRNNEIINAYCGSLFIGHCTSEQLVDHYNEFSSSLDSNFMHIGMDGPNVNLSFEEKLGTKLEQEQGTSLT